MKKIPFLETLRAIEIRTILVQMEQDAAYHTEPSYTADSSYPNNLISFVDKHMLYMSTHPQTNPDHYLANLKLMTRVR